MKKTIDLDQWMTSFIQEIEDHTKYLNGLDTAIGDGDHGDNMNIGVTKLDEYIDMHIKSSKRTLEDAKELFSIMSVVFLSNIEGASGPLYAAAFKRMAEVWDEEDYSLSQIIKAGAEAIANLGEAEFGDKTMLDVWHKIPELIEADELTNEKIDQLVADTENRLAVWGRASYFGPRSIGHIDPGAQSSAYFFKALIRGLETIRG